MSEMEGFHPAPDDEPIRAVQGSDDHIYVVKAIGVGVAITADGMSAPGVYVTGYNINDEEIVLALDPEDVAAIAVAAKMKMT